MEKLLNIIVKLGSVDRRYIFVLVGLAVLLPLIWPVDIPVRAEKDSNTVYETVEGLPQNSNVLVSFEYGPSTRPEIHPMAMAMLRHLFRNGHRVYATALWPDGVFMSTEAFSQMETEYDIEYGTDYVNLGYRPGNEAVVKGIAASIPTLYTADTRGNQLADIPMMNGIENVRNFDLVFSLSAGYPGSKEWVQFACDPNDVLLSTGCTSVQVTEVLPYVKHGQISGILAGMPGAAEYENLINLPDQATQKMAAQSFAHLIIVLFIIFGNITFFIQRKQAQKK